MSLIKAAQLLRKEIGLAAEHATKEGIRLPQNAATFDVVKVKKNDILTDIFTFKDENGKMIQRFIKKTKGKNVTETTRKYDELEPFDVPVTEAGLFRKDVNAKRIRSYTRTNGKISEIKEEVISHTDEKKPFMTKTARTIKRGAKAEGGIYKRPNYETISIEQRKNGKKPVFIENKYEVDLLTQGDCFLVESKISSPKLKTIAGNSFFLPYTSPDTKFTHRIAQACISDADIVALRPDVVLYKKAGNRLGYYRSDIDTVFINLMSEKGMVEPRTSLVNVAGHEIGHAKWETKVLLSEFDDIEINSLEEVATILEYKKAMKNYTPSNVDYKKYRSNYTEVKAREEGDAASRKYMDLSSKISKIFRFLHPEQFYILKENIRTENLSELLSKWT